MHYFFKTVSNSKTLCGVIFSKNCWNMKAKSCEVGVYMGVAM